MWKTGKLPPKKSPARFECGNRSQGSVPIFAAPRAICPIAACPLAAGTAVFDAEPAETPGKPRHPASDRAYAPEPRGLLFAGGVDAARSPDENTLVIFSSDDGPEHYAYAQIRNHGHDSRGPLRGLKRDVWEEMENP